jgi:hypothetical protein
LCRHFLHSTCSGSAGSQTNIGGAGGKDVNTAAKGVVSSQGREGDAGCIGDAGALEGSIGDSSCKGGDASRKGGNADRIGSSAGGDDAWGDAGGDDDSGVGANLVSRGDGEGDGGESGVRWWQRHE